MAIASPSATVIAMKSNSKFATGEYYHIFNRGVEQRQIFSDDYDLQRFMKSMEVFNSVDATGSIYECSFEEKKKNCRVKKLVEIVCYCLNHNHYHLLLKQVRDGGVGEFIRRLGIGYTIYFNLRNKRSGVLFQGRTKYVHVDSNDYLLYLSAYINLNHRIHKLGDRISKSSWMEYIGESKSGAYVCSKHIILDQFKNNKEYKSFSLETLENIRQKKEMYYDMKQLLLE